MSDLEKLREIYRQDIEHLIDVLADHVKDGWFTNDDIVLEWDVPMPYFGRLKLRKISLVPDENPFEKKVYKLPGRQKDYPVYIFSLHRDMHGECNFPRRDVSEMASIIAIKIGTQVFADFHALCTSVDDYFDYDGDHDIRAYRRRASIYGTDI